MDLSAQQTELQSGGSALRTSAHKLSETVHQADTYKVVLQPVEMEVRGLRAVCADTVTRALSG